MVVQSVQTATRTNRAISTRMVADMRVSVLCLGTMTFGSPVDEPEAIRMVHWSLDRGINFFDTADIYEGYTREMGSHGGVSEQILGKALKGKRRRAVVTTKAGAPVDGPDSTFDLSPVHLSRQIDRSLRHLGFDYVDIFELHHPDSRTPLADSIGAVVRLIEQGKARYWGFSNFNAEDVRRMANICDQHGFPRPVVSQPQISWLHREALIAHVPACQELNIAVTPYRVLESGLLTGKYQRCQPFPRDSRAADGFWIRLPDDFAYDRIEEFEATAHRCGFTPAQYAVRWLLDLPGVAACVIGAKRIDQIEAVLPACRGFKPQD